MFSFGLQTTHSNFLKEIWRERDQRGIKMELQGGEMSLPFNSTYGGGHGHGHMIHDESAPHNHIVPSSPASAVAAVLVQTQHQHQQLPITTGPTRIVPPPPSSSSMEEITVVVPYTTNNNSMMMVRYRECLKNHAVSIGGIATDGCGEFMPSGEEGTLEALTCSACNCHRNFHRKETEGEVHHHHNPLSGDYNHHSAPPHLNGIELGYGRKVLLQGHHHMGILGTESYGYKYNHINNAGVLAPPLIMSYDMRIGSFPSEFDEHDDGGGLMSRHPPLQPHQIVKKRFRTKFTQEQKEKMLSFAEKIGWKIQKQEESAVQQFCQELGIKRRVLKVWMHNNKYNLAKKINPYIPINLQSRVN